MDQRRGDRRERKGSFGEMALLDKRNGTSQVKKCRFSLYEEISVSSYDIASTAYA